MSASTVQGANNCAGVPGAALPALLFRLRLKACEASASEHGTLHENGRTAQPLVLKGKAREMFQVLECFAAEGW